MDHNKVIMLAPQVTNTVVAEAVMEDKAVIMAATMLILKYLATTLQACS